MNAGTRGGKDGGHLSVRAAVRRAGCTPPVAGLIACVASCGTNLIRAEEHESPSCLSSVLDEFEDVHARVLARRILLAVAEDHHHDVGAARDTAARDSAAGRLAARGRGFASVLD